MIFFLDNFKTILYITFGNQNTYDKTQIYGNHVTKSKYLSLPELLLEEGHPLED